MPVTCPAVQALYPIEQKTAQQQRENMKKAILFVVWLTLLMAPIIPITLLLRWSFRIQDLGIALAFGSIAYLIFLVVLIRQWMTGINAFLQKLPISSLLIVEPGQHARLKWNNQNYELRDPGCYQLRPQTLVFFYGTDEDWEHFDPLTL